VKEIKNSNYLCMYLTGTTKIIVTFMWPKEILYVFWSCETKQFSGNQVSNLVWISNNSICLQFLYTLWEINMVKGIISYSLSLKFVMILHTWIYTYYSNQVIMYICSYTISYKYMVNSWRKFLYKMTYVRSITLVLYDNKIF